MQVQTDPTALAETDKPSAESEPNRGNVFADAVTGPSLAEVDPDVFGLIEQEIDRQKTKLELIASENFVSRAVLQAAGSVLTNKYAEGYPGKRYYGGCEFVDQIEQLAIDRLKSLFGADHANVQPHSGAQANMAVYVAALIPGDTILGLALPHGGHLTHGHAMNFSGKYFHIEPYEVEQGTEVLDYDKLREKARQVKPKIIVAGASAYPRTLDFAAFGSIAKEVGALLMVDMAHIAGLVAAGLHPSPIPTPTSSPRPPTRPCADPAAASSCAPRSGRRRSTPRSSPASRAARSSTSSRPRRWPSRRP